MQIVENTPSTLRLRDQTLWIGAVFLGAAALIALASAGKGGEPRQLIPAGLFVLLGLVFLRSTDVTFDRVDRICRLRRFNVLRTTRRELAFSEIGEIRIDALSGTRFGSVSCRLTLVAGSEAIPLTASYEPGLARYTEMRGAIVEALAAGGRRPAAPDPARTLAKAGLIVDAVRVLRQRDGLDLTAARARAEEMRAASD